MAATMAAGGRLTPALDCDVPELGVAPCPLCRPLELAAFAVRELAAGDRTVLSDGVLTVDTAALEAACGREPGLLGMRR